MCRSNLVVKKQLGDADMNEWERERERGSICICFPCCLQCGDKGCFHKDRFFKRKQFKLWKVTLERCVKSIWQWHWRILEGHYTDRNEATHTSNTQLNSTRQTILPSNNAIQYTFSHNGWFEIREIWRILEWKEWGRWHTVGGRVAVTLDMLTRWEMGVWKIIYLPRNERCPGSPGYGSWVSAYGPLGWWAQWRADHLTTEWASQPCPHSPLIMENPLLAHVYHIKCKIKCDDTTYKTP